MHLYNLDGHGVKGHFQVSKQSLGSFLSVLVHGCKTRRGPDRLVLAKVKGQRSTFCIRLPGKSCNDLNKIWVAGAVSH